MTRPRAVRRIWAQRLDRPSKETATLFSTGEGWRLAGVVRTTYPEGPGVVRYRIDADRAWKTRTALLQLHLAGSRRSVHIDRDDRDRWEVGGLEQRDLRGCTDIDLSATATTNILPLRRLELPVGGRSDLRVAWVAFPDLELRPTRQIYTRISENRYHFEVPHNAFVAEFDVDELGIVNVYPGFWERVPRPTRSPPRRKGSRPPKARA